MAIEKVGTGERADGTIYINWAGVCTVGWKMEWS